MTLEEAQRARAEGLRRWFANPENRARRKAKNQEAQAKIWTPERRAWMSQLAKDKIASGEWLRGHSDETRAKIGEIVRRRYEEAKAEWLESSGTAALEGNLRWARIDWEFARELKAEGATVEQLAEFFKSQPSVIRRGLKNGK